MKTFEHINAKSIDGIISFLAEKDVQTKIMAGGTDFLSTLKAEIHETYPDRVINIKTLPNLDYIAQEEGTVRIGALAKLAAIAKSDLVKEKCPVLADAAMTVGSPQIRNMGTIGGNLCQETRCWYYRTSPFMGERYNCLRKGGKKCFAVAGDSRYHAIISKNGCWSACPSDMAVALSALDADIIMVGPKGTREVPISHFFGGLGLALEPDEIVTEIRITPPTGHTRQTYRKFSLRKAIDFSIVSVAAVIGPEEVRIALGGIAPMPLRSKQAEALLSGINVGEHEARQAAALIVEDAKPLKKNRYKVPITKALVERALSK